MPLCGNEQLQGLTVRFKENLEVLFPRLMAEPDRAAALRTLRALCAHSGDVLRLGSEYLRQHRYHLRTADKRLLVKLLEAYSVDNVRENMMLSRKARERNLVVLQHLDYNQYSRSAEHREAVRALRNGELRSWHGVGEALIQKRSPEALNHLAQRPGYMVRMLNRLLSLGYGSQAIADILTPRASAVSVHLLVKTIRSFSRREAALKRDHLREVASCKWEYKLKTINEEMAAQVRNTAVDAQRISALAMERDARLAELEAQYQASRRIYKHDCEVVGILMGLLKAHFRQADTPLKGKKVWLDMDQFDLDHSTLQTEDRSKDGGYIRSGISYRIPDDAKYVRFFVYWNDSERVDVDLHAVGITLDGESIHVGWNADFNDSGVVYSGDITHSDAAEYIDIDLSAPIQEINANLHLYYGKPGFGEVETCFVGMMAVSEANQEVQLYDPANCFFTQMVNQDTRNLFYGYIDVQNRFVRYIGKPNDRNWDSQPDIEAPDEMFSLRDYLDCLFEAQGAEYAASREEADVVLTMGKSLTDSSISLVDSNFFLEC